MHSMTGRRAAIILALLGLLAWAAPASAITFGEPDGNRHPYVGGLVVQIDDEIIGLCTGTLVAERVFVTAAHCILGGLAFGAEPGSFGVIFDEVFAETSTIWWGDETVHPFAFSGGHNNVYDVAVLQLDANPGITPRALLPTAQLLDGLNLRAQRFEAVGYGAIRDDKRGGPHALGPGGRRMLVEQGYLSRTSSWLTLSMNPSTGNGGTCFGDSGGPHFLAGTRTIVSVTVTGDAVCRATDTTYRLDTAFARDFLDDFVAVP